jgi:ferredoxin-NADP reductase
MYKYYVENSEKITPTTLLLTLKRYPSTRNFAFQPGQYAAISFKHNGRPTPARCFSIANSPTDDDVVQFSIRLKGRFTKALLDLKEGDRVNVRGPFGAFVLDADRDEDVVMIAGGIGIAPFMGMIQYASAVELSNKMKLIYSCRN